MLLLDEMRFIERQQFFHGQRLFAADLQGLEAFNREMRWLHNQSLHQPGIGNGFAVSGEKGAREVTIGPGYAIDAKGREIVLTETRKEPVPPVAGEADGSPAFYDLTVSYPADEYLEEAETRGGICNSHGVVRRREEPEFCWVPLPKDETGRLSADNRLGEDIKKGLKIVLARAEVVSCQLNSALSVAQRRSARPSSKPYIACASVKPTWDTFDLIEDAHDEVGFDLGDFHILPFGLRADVSTKVAGFATTPCYSARIAGVRIWPNVMAPNVDTFLVDGLVNIVDSRANGFRIEVFLMAWLVDISGGHASIRRDDIDEISENWEIVWMGVEG